MFDGFSSFVDSVTAEANRMAEEANKVAAGLSLDNLQKDGEKNAEVRAVSVTQKPDKSSAAAPAVPARPPAPTASSEKETTKLRESLEFLEASREEVTRLQTMLAETQKASAARTKELEEEVGVWKKGLADKTAEMETVRRELRESIGTLKEHKDKVEQLESQGANERKQYEATMEELAKDRDAAAVRADENLVQWQECKKEMRALEKKHSRTTKEVERTKTLLTEKEQHFQKELEGMAAAAEEGSSSAGAAAPASASAAASSELAKVKAELEALELKSSEDSATVEILREEMVFKDDALATAKDAFQKLSAKLKEAEEEVSGRKKEIQGLDAALKTQKGEASARIAESEKLSQTVREQEAALASTKQEMEDLRASLQEREHQATQALSSESAAVVELTAAVQAKTAEVEAARTEISSLEENVTTLSGKVRDLMGKVKDFRDKAAALETQVLDNGEKARAKDEELTVLRKGKAKDKASLEKLQATLQAKESELVKLRLKNDALDKAALDSKAETGQLSGRHTALQADLSELRSRIQEQENIATHAEAARKEAQTRIESLEKEVATRDDAVAAGGTALGEATREHQKMQEKLESRISVLESELALEKDSAAAALEKGLKAGDDKRVELSQEMDALRASLAAAQDSISDLETYKASSEATIKASNDALEAYKKKAQEALKRATAESVGMGSEVAELRAACQEKDDRLADAMAATTAAEEARVALAKTRKELERTVEGLEARVRDFEASDREAVEMMERSKFEHSSELSSLRRELDEHASAIAAANAARDEALEQLANAKRAKLRRSPLVEDRKQKQLQAQKRQKEQDEGSAQQTSPKETLATAPAVAVATQSSRESSNISAQRPFRAVTPPLTVTGLELSGGVQVEYEAPAARNVYFAQLQEQLAYTKKMVGQREADIESLMDDLQAREQEGRQLQERVDELVAYIERGKNKQQTESESHTSNEYLKNVIFHFMSATEREDKMRLLPVISTIFKFTDKETRTISGAVDRVGAIDAGVQGLRGLASSFLG